MLLSTKSTVLLQSTHCHNDMIGKLIAKYTQNVLVVPGTMENGVKKANSVKIAFGAKMSNASEWHMVKK